MCGQDSTHQLPEVLDRNLDEQAQASRCGSLKGEPDINIERLHSCQNDQEDPADPPADDLVKYPHDHHHQRYRQRIQ